MKKFINIASTILICILLLTAFTGCNKAEQVLPEELQETVVTATTTKHEESENSEVSGVDEYINENPIDKGYQMAITKIRNTKDYEITEDYSRRWKKEMECNFDRLNNMLSDEDKELLKSSQTEWEDYAKNELQLAYSLGKVFYLNEEERMNYNARAYYEIYRGRAIQLYKYRQEIISKVGEEPYFETEEETTEQND